jgi:hypothetical protein
VQEGEPRKQIVHQGLRPVWLVRITASACAEASKVNGVAEVNALLGLVSVKKSQERFAGLRVDVGAVTTAKGAPLLPFAGKARHEAAAYVKVLASNKSLETQNRTRK